MKKQFLLKHRDLLLALWCFLCVIRINAQTWTAPALTGSTLTSGTTYYVYNVGSNGYLTAGGNWGTQSVVSAQPRANASSSVVKYTATNTSGSAWTFQYNLNSSNVTNWFLIAVTADPALGSVETNDYWYTRGFTNPWNVVETDATNKIYSLQVPATFGGYVAAQYLGSASATESTNKGTANTVKFNRTSGDSYTQWKFISQADLDLYNAKILLDRYMTYGRSKGMDVTSYITTYNAGITADITTASATLLAALGRTDVTSSITNPSFESLFTSWTNSGFATQTNVPGQGWTKNGTTYAEKWIANGSNLAASTLTQTVTGLSSGLYELVVSGHAVQLAGANPLHTGAYITAGSQTTEVVAGQDYTVSNVAVPGSTLTIGYSLVAPIACNWTGFDNFRLYYYGPVPVISLSKSSLFISNSTTTTETFDVVGANLTADVTITAPTGITLTGANLVNNGGGTYTIALANANATNTITASWDESANLIANISVASTVAITQNISVATSKDSECYTPLYSTGNLVADPRLNSLSTFFGWGSQSINTDPTYAYCGARSGKIGPAAGSIDIHFTALKSKTKYRMKAMVYTIGGDFRIGLNDLGSGVANINNVFNTGGVWQTKEIEFTTGVGATSALCWFNNSSLSGTTGYIDNWEFFEVPSWNGTNTWNTAANWGGTVPSSGSDICVVSGSLTIDQNVNVANVTIYPGAALILNSGYTLTVTGNFTINSDVTGAGIFVDANAAGGLSVGGTSTVQQYITGAGATTPNGRFWYFSTPLTDATSTALAVESVSPINKLWSFSEAAFGYTPITANATGLTIGRGYVARLGDNKTVSLTGTALNSGNLNITATRTGTEHAKRGYNLVGNPYPSYLDINAAFNNVSTSGLESTVWYRSFNSGTNIMAYDTYNAVGGVGISLGSAGTALTNFIPPMQAFWVRATTDGVSGNLALTNAMRSYQVLGNMLRSANEDTICIEKIRLQLTNGRGIDQTLIGIFPKAMDSYEQYDSHKMFNDNDSTPEIYTFAGEDEVSINGLAPFEGRKDMKLGFRTRKLGRFTIKAMELLNLEAGTKVILKDHVLNLSQDLTETPEYTFTSDVAATTDRFTLTIVKAATFLDNTQKSSISIRSLSGGQMEINHEGSNKANVTVYDMIGKKVFAQDINSQNTTLSKTFSKGVYLVKVSVNGMEFAKMVAINQ